jgi:hypothetical protein
VVFDDGRFSDPVEFRHVLRLCRLKFVFRPLSQCFARLYGRELYSLGGFSPKSLLYSFCHPP